MRREGRLVPGAQAGHSGSGSFKLSLQEKSSISPAEKAAVKKSNSGKKVVKKGPKKGVKKSVKSSSKKSSGAVQKGVKMGKKLSKKVVVKAKKTVPRQEKAKK